MTEPRDRAAAGGDRLRAARADREQVIEALKAAFVQGMLAKDEFDARVGQALASRTSADLATLTADVPPAPAAARLARPPAPVRRRPLARAAAGAGGCLVIAAAAVWGAFILDPGPNAPGPPGALSPGLMFVIALYAVLAALGFLIAGMSSSVKQRRSRRQLPPAPGPGGHAVEGEQSEGTGHRPVPPGPRADKNRADLRAHKPQQLRRHVPAWAAQAPSGARPASQNVLSAGSTRWSLHGGAARPSTTP